MAFARCTLESLAESVDYGVTASANFSEAGPQFLRITDIQDNGVDWSTVPFCKTTPTEEASARLGVGDIVFARTGATTGKSYLLSACPERAVFASYLIRVRPNRQAVEPRYLAWYFQTADYWRQITSSASGTAQPGVNATKLKALSVPRPPLPEQRRIADILDKADAIRRKRKEAIALTEELLRSAFLEMFGDPVSNPKGWPLKTLGLLSDEMRYGTSEKCSEVATDGSLPVLRIPNVVSGLVKWRDMKYAQLEPSEVERLLLQDGDILFVRSNGNPEYIARCAVFEGTAPALFASYLIRVRVNTREVAPKFVQAVLGASSYRHVLTRAARTTAGNYNISTEGLRALVLPVPPANLQHQYHRMHTAVQRSLVRLAAAVDVAEVLFDSLVHRAFRGELTGANGAAKPQLALFESSGR